MGSRRTLDHYSEHVGGMWAKLSLVSAGVVGRDTELHLYLRIWFLALARMRNGHAAFQSGELQKLLGKADGTMFDERSIRKAIRALRRMRLVGQSSNTRCIQIPIDVVDFQGDRHRGLNCPTCKTTQVWTNRPFGQFIDSDLVKQYVREIYTGGPDKSARRNW